MSRPRPGMQVELGGILHPVDVLVDRVHLLVDLRIGNDTSLWCAVDRDQDVEARVFRAGLLICAAYAEEALLRRMRLPFVCRPVQGSYSRFRVELADGEQLAQVEAALQAAARAVLGGRAMELGA